jgi:serine/threonine-protein kinase
MADADHNQYTSPGIPVPPSTDPPDLPVGYRVNDRYLLKSLLYHDARGRGYRAANLTDSSFAVVKLLPRKLTGADPSAWKKHWEAFRAFTQLDHPQLERLLSLETVQGETEALYAILAAPAEGETLHTHLRGGGRLSAQRVMSVTTAVTRALGAIHQAGLVHGDIRTSTVVLSGNIATVRDAGLLTLLIEGSGRTPYAVSARSPHFLAPELIRGEAPSVATDLYALGCLVFRMLCGRAPFVGDSAARILKAHLTQPAPHLSALLGPGIAPSVLEHLVAACLEKSPAQRPRDCAEVLQLLDESTGSVQALTPAMAAALLEEAFQRPSAPSTSSSGVYVSDIPSGSRPLAAADPSHPPTARVTRQATGKMPAFAPRTSQAGAQSPPREASQPFSHDDVTRAERRPAALNSAATSAARTSSLRSRLTAWVVPVAAFLSLLSALLAWFTVFRRPTIPPAATGTSTLATAPPAPSERSPVVVTSPSTIVAPTPPPALPPIRFEILSRTRNAEVVLRGRTYPAPIRIELRPGSEPEMVEVQARGHITRRMWLTLDQSMSLDVNLDRGRGQVVQNPERSNPRAPSTRPSGPRWQSTRPAPMTLPPAPPTSAPVPAPTPSEPAAPSPGALIPER